MALILLGISSGLCWGTADFFGGLQSRRLPTLAVALWSQIAGAVVLAAVLAASGTRLDSAALGWGAVGGLFSGAGLVLFYRGLAIGTMSIVAPLSACGALVPVLVALATGHAPSGVALAGIGAAIGGVILVSLQAEESHHVQHARLTLALALGSALGFGAFYVFVDYGSAGGGAAPLWTTGGARIGSLAMLLMITVASRRGAPWPGPRIGKVAAVGIVDTTANVLFAYASTRGNLGVAAVLGSLYPVTTVLLGRLVLAERLSKLQNTGVVLALLGVALLSAG